MGDIYRPLFVIVDAVEAECRRLPEPLPTPRRSLLSDCETIMRRLFDEPTLHIVHEIASGDVRIGHHCKVCRKSHSLVFSEIALAAAHSPPVYIADQVRRLLEMPCDVELRKAAP